MSETLDGILHKIVSHKPGFNPAGTPYLIGRLVGGRTVRGDMMKPREGESYRFHGHWRPQKKYPEPAFFFDTFEVIIDRSEEGISKYLSDYVPGLGRIKSAALVAAFGSETLDVLRSDPDRAMSVSGISADLACKIRKHFEEDCPFDPAAFAALVDLFADHAVPRRVVTKLLGIFGSNAMQAIRDNPYLMLALPRMGWETVDSLAMSKLGYDPAGVARHAAAIVEALRQLSLDGHTFGIRGEVEAATGRLLGGPVGELAWGAALATDAVVRDVDTDGREVWALANLDRAERTIAERFAALATHSGELPVILRTDGLDGLQVDAARMIGAAGLSILSGGPGTGKTHTITHIIKQVADSSGLGIMCMAPTGKASKRIMELMARVGIPPEAVPSSTIHKALGPKPSAEDPGIPKAEAKLGRGRDEFGFIHGPDNLLPVDLAIVDELSMVDVSLGAALLEALPLGCRVVLVGDHNQLPSVGPGSVLRDALDSGVPATVLTEIRRNSGRIVRACHAIKAGEIPEPADNVDFEAGDNWVHQEIEDPAEIGAEIVRRFEAVRRNPASRFDPLWDMQVVSAQIDRPPGICCRDVNRALSPILNPSGAAGPAGDADDHEPPFRVGDKVVRIKNGLADELVPLPDRSESRTEFAWRGVSYQVKETAVVNGDIGQVIDVVRGSRDVSVVVRFLNPERLCRLPYGDANLIQAYALTVHKLQGSSAPYIILPVHGDFFWNKAKQIGIWNRELLYTAFSRAETLLVTIGPFSAIKQAVGRKTVHRRRTRLAERLATAMGGRPPAARMFKVPAVAPEPPGIETEVEPETEPALPSSCGFGGPVPF